MHGSACLRCRTGAISTGSNVRSRSTRRDPSRNSTRVGFVPSRKLRHAIKREVESRRGGFDFHCPPRALGLAGCRLVAITARSLLSSEIELLAKSLIDLFIKSVQGESLQLTP